MMNPWAWNPAYSAVWDATIETPFGTLHLAPMLAQLHVLEACGVVNYYRRRAEEAAYDLD